MANNTFKEIAEVLLKAEKILIYPHINADGDAVGSAAALCHGLRSLGKTAYVLVEDQIPANLRFMDKGLFTSDLSAIQNPDVSVCVDCGDYSRFPQRREKFDSAEITVCIDHHGTTENFCDYNYVDPAAAATGELIYGLIKAMGVKPDVETGEAIFAAITTDTGNFQYSNTTKNCHIIMAELFDLGVDTNRVSVEIYENERPQKLMVTTRALSTLEIFGRGRGAVAYITLGDMEEIGAEPFETDSVIENLRSISGVEYAAFVKEKEPGVIRVSLRAKRRGNVATIASELGGGGHVKAAGCTLYMTVEEAVALMKSKLSEAIEAL
ncbi:MAG: bifunctional oligoribonuclease/PAP phosphatase NrnA [Anaerovoracaceae bacterium]